MTNDDRTYRCFIAIEPPEEAIDALWKLREELRAELGETAFRWVSRPNLHITLHFLGDVERQQIDGLCGAMNAACESCDRFVLDATSVGCFPNNRRARVVWAGFADSSASSKLQGHLGDELQTRDFPVEKRAFTPHVTLARAKRHARPDEIRAAGERLQERDAESICRFEVASITLIRSQLRRQGPVYSALHRSSLGSGS
jgi:2'-5' RNA ligase